MGSMGNLHQNTPLSRPHSLAIENSWNLAHFSLLSQPGLPWCPLCPIFSSLHFPLQFFSREGWGKILYPSDYCEMDNCKIQKETLSNQNKVCINVLTKLFWFIFYQLFLDLEWSNDFRFYKFGGTRHWPPSCHEGFSTSIVCSHRGSGAIFSQKHEVWSVYLNGLVYHLTLGGPGWWEEHHIFT